MPVTVDAGIFTFAVAVADEVLYVAVIVAVPFATAVTSPPLLTVATAVLLEP
jgi:hypothetical protein